jgi:hypothetical protein
MSKSNRVTMTRPDLTTVWPFEAFSTVRNSNFGTLENAGVETWIHGTEATDLTLVVDHVVTDDALFDTYQEYKAELIPLWISPESATEAAAYILANNITISEEVVQDPDLTGYERVTATRPV